MVRVGPAEDRTAASHPLDPLSADEIRVVTAVVRRDKGVGPGWRYASIELKEPSKRSVRRFVPEQEISREAIITCWNRNDGRVFKAVVSIGGQRLVSWEHRPGVQANLTYDEDRECGAALRAEPRVAEALRRRGLEDMDAVHFEVWGIGGHHVPERHRDRRVGWIDVWHLASEGANPYANAVSGLHFFVDLNTMELLEVEDSYAIEPAPVMGEYRPGLVPGQVLRDDVRALEVVQPEGASFTLDGNLLEWQKWSMRLGFNGREGLVLHTVGYRDGQRLRPIAHRMSLAELVSPYRDPSPDHRRRMAYDAGEWGLGYTAASLELGCDCLGEIVYLDAVLHDSKGEPSTARNAICVHEEDDAVLWKHVDPIDGGAEVRRRRRLVVSFQATIANYDYFFYWRFYQDGSIECEVRATGIMVTTQFVDGEQPPYGVPVDERTYAPHHQHFVVARLDLDVDGERNTATVTEPEALPVGPNNSDGLAVVLRRKALRDEYEGKQDYDWRRQRTWTVVNEGVGNGLGTRVGYQLVPTGCIPAMMDPSSRTLRRVQAIMHDLWITPYDPDERWPCGEFVVQSEDDAGLPAWTAANRPIQNTDVVLWHVFGINHVPRPEDWPVMPVDTTSFWLRPVGFFDRNPALDVPPNPHASHPGSGHACHPQH